MVGRSKAEANAHDRMVEAAAELTELIERAEVRIDELDLEELSLFLAEHAVRVKEILRPVKRRWH